MIVAAGANRGKTKHLINLCNEANGYYVTKAENEYTLRQRGLKTPVLVLKEDSEFESIEEMSYFLKKITNKHVFVDNINSFINKRPDFFMGYNSIPNFSFSLQTLVGEYE